MVTVIKKVIRFCFYCGFFIVAFPLIIMTASDLYHDNFFCKKKLSGDLFIKSSRRERACYIDSIINDKEIQIGDRIEIAEKKLGIPDQDYSFSQEQKIFRYYYGYKRFLSIKYNIEDRTIINISTGII